MLGDSSGEIEVKSLSFDSFQKIDIGDKITVKDAVEYKSSNWLGKLVIKFVFLIYKHTWINSEKIQQLIDARRNDNPELWHKLPNLYLKDSTEYQVFNALFLENVVSNQKSSRELKLSEVSDFTWSGLCNKINALKKSLGSEISTDKEAVKKEVKDLVAENDKHRLNTKISDQSIDIFVEMLVSEVNVGQFNHYTDDYKSLLFQDLSKLHSLYNEAKSRELEKHQNEFNTQMQNLSRILEKYGVRLFANLGVIPKLGETNVDEFLKEKESSEILVFLREIINDRKTILNGDNQHIENCALVVEKRVADLKNKDKINFMKELNSALDEYGMFKVKMQESIYKELLKKHDIFQRVDKEYQAELKKEEYDEQHLDAFIKEKFSEEHPILDLILDVIAPPEYAYTKELKEVFTKVVSSEKIFKLDILNKAVESIASIEEQKTFMDRIDRLIVEYGQSKRQAMKPLLAELEQAKENFSSRLSGHKEILTSFEYEDGKRLEKYAIDAQELTDFANGATNKKNVRQAFVNILLLQPNNEPAVQQEMATLIQNVGTKEATSLIAELSKLLEGYETFSSESENKNKELLDIALKDLNKNLTTLKNEKNWNLNDEELSKLILDCQHSKSVSNVIRTLSAPEFKNGEPKDTVMHCLHGLPTKEKLAIVAQLKEVVDKFNEILVAKEAEEKKISLDAFQQVVMYSQVQEEASKIEQAKKMNAFQQAFTQAIKEKMSPESLEERFLKAHIGDHNLAIAKDNIGESEGFMLVDFVEKEKIDAFFKDFQQFKREELGKLKSFDKGLQHPDDDVAYSKKLFLWHLQRNGSEQMKAKLAGLQFDKPINLQDLVSDNEISSFIAQSVEFEKNRQTALVEIARLSATFASFEEDADVMQAYLKELKASKSDLIEHERILDNGRISGIEQNEPKDYQLREIINQGPEIEFLQGFRDYKSATKEIQANKDDILKYMQYAKSELNEDYSIEPEFSALFHDDLIWSEPKLEFIKDKVAFLASFKEYMRTAKSLEQL